MYKAHQVQSTFCSWDVEKVDAVVVRSTFPSQNVQSTPGSDDFLQLRCRKSGRRCGAKHISKSKCTKHIKFGAFFDVEISKKWTPLWHEAHFEVKMYKAHQGRTTFGSWDDEKVKHICTPLLGPLLEVDMSEKCTLLWREANFEVKMLKATHARTTFEGSDVVLRGRRKWFCTLPKVHKTWGFCSISENDGRRVTFEEDLQRCISRGRRSTRDIFVRDVRRSGRWFPERGCILEHQIFRFAEMILRDRCSTS